jgi:biotin operon repressor
MPKRRAFAMVSLAIASTLRATGNTLLVWIALLQHANSEGRTWVSVPTLAAECGMSETNVYSCIRKLVARGLVKRHPGEFFVFDGLRHFPEMETITRPDASRQRPVMGSVIDVDGKHQDLKGSNRPGKRPGEKTCYKTIPYNTNVEEQDNQTTTQAETSADLEPPEKPEYPAELEPPSDPADGEDAGARRTPRKQPSRRVVSTVFAAQRDEHSAVKLCANYLAAKRGDVPTWLAGEYEHWLGLIEIHGVDELKRVIDHCCENYETSYEWPKITVTVIKFWSKYRYIAPMPRVVLRRILLNRQIGSLSRDGDYMLLARMVRRHHVTTDDVAPWTLPDDTFARLVADGSIKRGLSNPTGPLRPSWNP